MDDNITSTQNQCPGIQMFRPSKCFDPLFKDCSTPVFAQQVDVSNLQTLIYSQKLLSPHIF